MADLTERIAALPPKHRALFERQLLRKGLDPRGVGGIPRRAARNFCPLTVDQERLWFIDQLQPGTPAYNISSASRLEGPLDLAALRRGVEELVRRHEILRTAFPAREGEPRQFVSDSLAPELPTVDLSGVDADAREAELQRRMTERTQEPFDLSKGPLLRLTLYRLGEEEHVLLVTMHHTITDRWSFSLFWRELSMLYKAFAAGERSALAELPIQFADYAVWQRQQLAGEGLAERLDYWRRQLAGAPDVLTLPTDYARPRVAGCQGARLFWSPERELWEELRRFNQRHGVTMFMTMLAAFNILLRRYTGQESINVGSPFANRDRVETEGLIGFLLNMLVLRTDLSGDPTVLALLGRVRETALGAYAHNDLPFGLLVEELQPERDPGRNPLYQVAFVLVDMQDTLAEVAGLRMSSVEVLSGLSRLDLMLGLRDDAEHPTVLFEYNAELFEERTVARMLGHLEVLLGAMLEAPGRRISELPLLTEAERRQLLLEFNDPAAGPRPDRCLHELFAEQVARTPERTAVVCGGERLSYAELDERAARLARVLLREGVGPESAVGLCVERSAEMVVGLLGILKAGAAFVPLDPAYPAERLAYMLGDAGVEVLLTRRELLARLPRLEVRALCAETDWREEGEAQPNAEARALPDNLAYVIYTSGSTGRPKGTLCTHRGVLNLLSDFVRRGFGGAGARCSFWTSPSFDVSLYEIFCPLLTGGELHVVPEELRADSAAFIEWLRAREIECAYLPPFLLPALGEWLAHEGHTLSLRSLLVGVEPIPERVLAAISERLRGLRIVNGYGPTEASVCATLYEVPARARAEAHAPIGRPVIGNAAHVLCDARQLAPVGVTGELHLGGVGLARGYAGRPALTAERFVPDPFSAEPGARLYRTGDLARWSGKGQLEFVGRVDRQLKVRGHRIEPGEIEAALCEHPRVEQSVVVAREVKGDKRLVAYYVPREGENVEASELREHLRGRLPEYMVPTSFVALDALPLTPNGKVDRKALPEPDAAGGVEQYVAPRTASEEVLCDIFGRVLGVERVGVKDNFFELGGHSLLATQVISRVREVFGVELPLRALFERPIVSAMAAGIDAALRTGSKTEAPPVVRVARDGRLPLSFAQQRLWFLDQLEPGNAFYNIPLAVRLKGALNLAAFERTLGEVVRRHEVLRTSFVVEGGQPVQVVAPPRPLGLEQFDLGGLPVEEREAEARRLAGEEARAPFDLSTGPLVRGRLIRLAEEEHVVLLNMHHAVSDGWSSGVLVNEVAALYGAFSKGEPSPLPELPIQYADYAAWQRGWLQGELLEAQLSYWKKQLEALTLLELPTDRPRPPVQTYRGAHHTFHLDESLTDRLKELSRREGCTLFMALLAGFQLLLSRYTGQDDIVVGTPIAGRTRAELEPLIGLFVNTLALRTDLSGNPSFVELMRRVREVTLGAYAHQDVPFERLVEELRPDRDMSRQPLFQVMFALQNATTGHGGMRLPGLELSPAATGAGTTSKFDLMLTLTEEGAGLRGTLEYCTDLFESETVERMADHFKTLLEAVVSDPFSEEPGARLYRTGEGQLEFVGRVDRQLKARGHRVEPGELETVLGEHTEVLAAVVTADCTPPRNPTETLLAGIWAEQLGVERVGVHEGFFELGGHSLLAASIVWRVRQLFQIELSLQQFFEAETVAGLAALIEEMLYAEVASMSEEEAAV